jgi:hypothetical protein
MNPQKATRTMHKFQTFANRSGADIANYVGGGMHFSTTPFDGITFLPNAGGTITLEVFVYGYRK